MHGAQSEKILWEAGVVPDPAHPQRTVNDARIEAGQGSRAHYSAIVFKLIQELRQTPERDNAVPLAIWITYLFHDGQYQYEVFEPHRRHVTSGGQANKQKAEDFWKPWKARFAALLDEEFGPHKARDIIRSEMKAAGCERSVGRIKANLKTK
jgi:hypothetical protein